MTNPDKKNIRETIKQMRFKKPISYRQLASTQVCNRIHSLENYRNAQRIAFYFAVNGEIDLNNLWKIASMQGKSCYFPIINENDLTLSFLPANPDTPFKKNRYGIPEPHVSHDLILPLEELDLVIVPLVAFDVRCSRLGMGAGYYDRTFKDKKTGKLFGVAYQFQRIDSLTQEPWDIQLDAVITQRAVYWYSGD